MTGANQVGLRVGWKWFQEERARDEVEIWCGGTSTVCCKSNRDKQAQRGRTEPLDEAKQRVLNLFYGQGQLRVIVGIRTWLNLSWGKKLCGHSKYKDHLIITIFY